MKYDEAVEHVKLVAYRLSQFQNVQFTPKHKNMVLHTRL